MTAEPRPLRGSDLIGLGINVINLIRLRLGGESFAARSGAAAGAIAVGRLIIGVFIWNQPDAIGHVGRAGRATAAGTAGRHLPNRPVVGRQKTRWISREPAGPRGIPKAIARGRPLVAGKSADVYLHYF